jgi:uncharacterized membrane protein
MSNQKDEISNLEAKLKNLAEQHESFSAAIFALQRELALLKNQKESQTAKVTPSEKSKNEPVAQKDNLPLENRLKLNYQQKEKKPAPLNSSQASPKSKAKRPIVNFEKFIGENLINKIGIAITIIGVGIGAKYSIDNNLLSPLARIVLGYVFGAALLGVGFKLKKNYHSFSAVLVSGAMAIMYFLTFLAYDFYQLIPQAVAFGFMLLFTVFTVVAALNYQKQIIAHIGLVGAYATPLLLSSGSGQVAVLFSYMALINVGILFIAVKKYWQPLYYVAFILTWTIFGLWFEGDYNNSYFSLAFGFSLIFFALFYATFLANKLLQKRTFSLVDVLALLANAFIFYGLGFAILNYVPTLEKYIGAFTLANAVLHFGVSVLIYSQKLADRNLFYLVSGLVLTFVTIAVPAQLNGNWVTLLWAAEAALLFWIGRSKKVMVYEKLSYPLMVLASFSLVQDWQLSYLFYNDTKALPSPIFNSYFLSSLLFIGAFSFIRFVHLKHKPAVNLTSAMSIYNIGVAMSAIILVAAVYFSFFLEIANYWQLRLNQSLIKMPSENSDYVQSIFNNDYKHYRLVWLVNYSLIFAGLFSFIGLKTLKSNLIANVNLVLNLLAALLFLTIGLHQISGLRESYVDQANNEFYNVGAFAIGIRYISLLVMAGLLWVSYNIVMAAFLKKNYVRPFQLLLHSSILWVASSELIHWLHFVGANETYKLGLSILWGVYALFLIILGIWKNNKYLRIVAISLFGVTLLKLFAYDIQALNTLGKTSVFVSLGVLLLIISFLYNKYKHIISDENEV